MMCEDGKGRGGGPARSASFMRTSTNVPYGLDGTITRLQQVVTKSTLRVGTGSKLGVR